MKETIELIRRSVNDPEIMKKIETGLLHQARKTAMLLGSFLTVALLGVVYGFVKDIAATESAKRASELQTELETAKLEVEKQAALAIEARMIAEEAAKVAYEELEECRKKK